MYVFLNTIAEYLLKKEIVVSINFKDKPQKTYRETSRCLKL